MDMSDAIRGAFFILFYLLFIIFLIRIINIFGIDFVGIFKDIYRKLKNKRWDPSSPEKR